MTTVLSQTDINIDSEGNPLLEGGCDSDTHDVLPESLVSPGT